jgi:protein associated with RNAse G/E
MLVRTAILYMIMLTGAVAFHDNTFAVFDLKEQLQILVMNLWELLQQLEYVEPHQRLMVYEEIQAMRADIQRVVDQLVEHDRTQHP